MNNGNREDYLINILRLTEGDGVVRTSELASFMNVAPASVTEMVRVLSDAGFVNYQKYKGVSLTPEGLEYARNIRRKHHIVERFLTDVLDIDHESAHEEACRMEHSMSDDSANRMCRFIGTKVDHDCSTCDNPCDSLADVVTVAELEPGDSGIVSHLKCEGAGKIKRLLSMGFIPGRTICLNSKQEGGPRIIRIGETMVALDEELASLIYVEPTA